MTLAQFHALQQAADAIVLPRGFAGGRKAAPPTRLAAARPQARPARKLLGGLTALRATGRKN